MPSLLDKLKSKARDQLEELDEQKLRDQVGTLLAQARSSLDGLDTSSPIYMVASQGLAQLEANTDELGRLGALGVLAFTAELASGDEEAAGLVYLRTLAGWDDLFSAIDGAQAADVEQERRYRDIKATVIGMLKNIGTAGAKAALPHLLKVVGL